MNDKPSWNYGAPLRGADGCSINMDLQLLYAYQMMADLERALGNTYLAEVTLPKDVDGLFIWNGQQQYVRGGKNTFTL